MSSEIGGRAHVGAILTFCELRAQSLTKARRQDAKNCAVIQVYLAAYPALRT